jgi:hopene-associated glycosyltransferase HpnB
VLPVLAWIYLLTARGGFWLAPRRLPPEHGTPAVCRIVAVIPARNEAAVIGAAVASLLQQDFAGELRVIVVDDGSSDDTAGEVARVAARMAAETRVTVVRGAALESGWTGKLWAMSQGLTAAAALAPEYLLLTDADILHERGNVASLVAIADSDRRDLVSSMVRLSTRTLAERLLIPAFVFFFFKLYPPAWVASDRSRTSAAAGGCMLIRPEALRRIGGLEAIRSEIIDDCALARAVKCSGGRVSLGLTAHARSLRLYGSLREVGAMISRTAFNQLRHSWLLLAATLLGLVITYLLPLALLVSGDMWLAALGGLAWGLMTLCYLPMVRFYGLGPWWGLSLPLVTLFYGGATLHSAGCYALGRGGEWKGRIQDSRT